MNRFTKYFFRTFVLLICLFLLFASFSLILISYDDFVFFILEKAGKLDKIAKFKTVYLSKEKFQFLQYAIVLLTSFFLFVIVKKFRYFENKFTGFVDFINKGIAYEIRSISKANWYIFILVFLLTGFIKLYYFFTQPITNDEAFTWLNYVKPGFLAAVSYYNLTNNHILHSLFCNVFDLLPVSPVYSLRITSFIAGLLSLFAAFVFFNKFLNTQAKFIAFLFFAFSLPVLQYGVLARGYSLLLFFTIVSSFILLELCKNKKNRKKLWAVFVISSILGFYSLPVYVYVFASQTVFYMAISIKNKEIGYLKEFFTGTLITVVIVGVLYAPVLFINGIDAITGYDFMQALPIKEFLKNYPDFIIGYFVWISGANHYFALFSFIVLITGLIYSFKSKHILFVFIVSFLSVPLLMSVFQRIIPFNRLFVFNSLIIGLSFGLFVEFLLKKINLSRLKVNLILTTGSFVMSIILFLSFSNLCKQEKEINRKAYHYADLVEDNTSIFNTNEVRYYTFLKFKAMVLDKKQIELFRTNFNRNYPYTYISENKDKNEAFSGLSRYKYRLIYEDEYIRLYKISVYKLRNSD